MITLTMFFTVVLMTLVLWPLNYVSCMAIWMCLFGSEYEDKKLDYSYRVVTGVISFMILSFSIAVWYTFVFHIIPIVRSSC